MFGAMATPQGKPFYTELSICTSTRLKLMNVLVPGSVTAALVMTSLAPSLIGSAHAEDYRRPNPVGDAEAVTANSTITPPRPQPDPVPFLVTSVTTGLASWYGPGFQGRRSASGEIFNQYALTAAHRTLPFGTRVRVTNLDNGRQVIVRINDRGPFNPSRMIDLSTEAAASIDMLDYGVVTVRVEVLSSQ